MRISDWSSDVCSSDLLQQLLNNPGDRLGPRGRLHAVARPDEKRIPQSPPQACQSMTCRGLRKIEISRCGADAAPAQQRVETYSVPEIQIVDIHNLNCISYSPPIDK